MEITPPKVRRAVDGDVGIELLRRRAHQLRGYIQASEEELAEIKQKLRIRADELHADQLTVGGETVISISHFERYTIAAKKIAELHPKIFNRFGLITEVTRVEIR